MDAHRPEVQVPPQPAVVSPDLLEVIGVPAMGLSRDLDIVAWNRQGHGLLAGHVPYSAPYHDETRPNWAALLTSDPLLRDLFVDWADECAEVMALRDGSWLPTLLRQAAAKAEAPRDCPSPGLVRLHHATIGSVTLERHLLCCDYRDAAIGSFLMTFHADRSSRSGAALTLLGHVDAGAGDTLGSNRPAARRTADR